jgi:hypothetical protein
MLLVCTSFSPESKHVVRSSLLTKLTDYMAAGKPILSCGPAYSACNRFIEKWDCGITCSSQSVESVKKIIKKSMSKPEMLHEMADRATLVLEENFSEIVVTNRFYDFIAQMSGHLVS